MEHRLADVQGALLIAAACTAFGVVGSIVYGEVALLTLFLMATGSAIWGAVQLRRYKAELMLEEYTRSQAQGRPSQSH